MLPRLPALPSDAESRIVTARLELEPLCCDHAGDMFPVLSDAALYEYMGGEPPTSAASVAELYARWESRRSPDGSELWLNWVIRRRESRELIGHAQATIGPAHAYIAWVIGTGWKGRGYASESAIALVGWLTDLGVTEIRACVNPAHEASQKVAMRAGLRRTCQCVDGEDVWLLRTPHA